MATRPPIISGIVAAPPHAAATLPLLYLDHSSTTPVLPSVCHAMQPFLGEIYGNPASPHRLGRAARKALEDARDRIALLLGALPEEVLFTSGATEANNLALFGLAGSPPAHLLCSPVEHPSVLEPIDRLASIGFSVDRLSVDAHGLVRVDQFRQRLRADTRLCAVMLANHEMGALQPVAQLASAVRDRTLPDANCKTVFHCDAVQAVGKVPIHFHELGVTTLSASAHKFNGPKGIGVLLARRGAKPVPLTLGGHQQQGRRPGTEPVALAVGMAAALELACQEMAARRAHVLHLRQCFLDMVRADSAPVVVNGPDPETGQALPYVLNVSFPGCKADSLLINLDLAGVACSTGSACSSGSLLPSPVLKAMGVADDVLHSAMRFSFSHLLSDEDVADAARRVAQTVARLRSVAV